MEEVITFNKSLQQRLQEYLGIFEMKPLTISQIKNTWSYYLEQTMDPNGWQAVWKIPRLTCKRLKIGFPTLALVYVDNINFEELKTAIKILLVENGEQLPEQYVPLIELFPTKIQAETIVLCMDKTSNSLDMFRFFYNELLMPWEKDDCDECINWLKDHLESRLRLYYDMKLGLVPESVKRQMLSLKSEAKTLQSRKDLLQIALAEQCDDFNEDHIQDERIQKLLGINVQIIRIKTNFKLLEEPSTRPFFNEKELNKEITVTKIWLVISTSNIQETLIFLNSLKSSLNCKTVTIHSNLDYVLNNCSANDALIINHGEYYLRSIGALKYGGTLRGVLKNNTIPKLVSLNEEIMFDLQGDMLLENLTIDATNAEYAFLIRSGRCLLKNCIIIGNKNCSTQQGIIVLQEATLEMRNCTILDFYTSIVANKNASIRLNDCEIKNSYIGLKLVNAICYFENCAISNSRHYAVDATVDNRDENIGKFDVLNSLPNIQAQNVKGYNNVMGDVIINKKSHIRALSDLFLNPDLNPTILNSTAHMNSFEFPENCCKY